MKPSEFFQVNDFRYGLPVFVLDFVDSVTGSNFIGEVQKLLLSQKIRDLMDPDDGEYLELRDQIDEGFLHITFYIFDQMGELDFNSPGLDKYTETEKESKQYITIRSLKANMHKVFGSKNDLFAKMLFLYISGYAQLSQPVSYK